jgi:acyl carrier protein
LKGEISVTSEMQARIDRRRDLTCRIKKVLIDRLDLKIEPDEITEDAHLFGMGMALDSIDALVLIVGIEDEFNVTVETGDHHIYRSINTLTDHILSLSAEEEVQAVHA